MKQSLFESRYQKSWEAFDQRLMVLETHRGKVGKTVKEADVEDFAAAYRSICQQLALAQERGYSSYLIDPLQQLAMRGHQQLYRHRSHFFGSLIAFLLVGFPRRVRAEWSFVLIAGVLFFGSLIGMGILVYMYPDLIYSAMTPAQVTNMESMYDPSASTLGKGVERASSDDLQMFGFYIMHNIGIGFQTFASGFLAGIGSAFFLLFNGVTIGAVAGHLTQIGYNRTFWSFVVGHGAFELTAIMLSGAAGLKLGWALIAPGRRTRGEALQWAAKRSLELVYGVIVFLMIAAFLEAYWSSTTIFAPLVKFIVGGCLWAAVIAYLVFAGRGAHAPD